MELQRIARSPAEGDGTAVPRCAGQFPRHRNQHSRASRQSALERLSHPRRARARHHLDSRRAGGDARRRAVGGIERKPDAAILQSRRRACQQRLSCRRRAGRARLRLAHRSHRAAKAVLHHARALSHRHGCDRAVVECRELRAVSFSHRRRDRRRIHRDQLDDPGTGAGALSRLDRSRHQRQFLDRRCDRRGRGDRAARSGGGRSRYRLAARLFHRRRPWPHRVRDADVDSGKPALADGSWPTRPGPRHR